MPMPDFFNTDGFNLVSLTESINKLPFAPSRIGKMGLFSSRGISTKSVAIEEKQGVLSLLPSTERGAPATLAKHVTRKIRRLECLHIPYEDSILASDLIGARQFGSEGEVEGITSVVNDKLETMRQDHEVTLEWLKLGAIKGQVIDGDGTKLLFNLFTEFEITPPADVDFLLGTDTTEVGDKILQVVETIEKALGATVYDHIHAFCGEQFFRAMVKHPEVKYAFQYENTGSFLREDVRSGFPYKNVIFEPYRGKVGSASFIDETTNPSAHFFPVGVKDLFVTNFAPADFMEEVGSLGLPIYAKQEPMEFDRGVKIHTQSNPLPLCTRPGTLVKGITTT